MSVESATWTHITSSERLDRSSQAVSVVDHKLYVFGGEIQPRQPVDNKVDLIQLDGNNSPILQSLDAASEAPTPRVGSPSTTTANGKIWIFSGRGGLEMTPLEENGGLWGYDAATNQWNLTRPANPDAPFPAGRSYHCIASNGTDRIFVHAGCPSDGRLSDLWAFDLATKTWTELASAPAPARGGPSLAFVNGKLYRMNGFDGKTEQGGALDIFDLASGSWTTLPYTADQSQGPEARSVATLLPVSVGGRVYLVTLFGERDPSSLGHAGAGKMLNDVWAFDIEKEQWIKVQTGEKTPEARGWFDADVVKGDRGDEIIVHGGLSENNSRLGDVWSLRF